MSRRRSTAPLTLPGLDAAPRAVTPLSRATSSRRSDRRPAPVPRPWLCCVLAVDTAARSGWCIGARGARVASGEVSVDDEPKIAQIVANAVEVASASQLPCVLVLEAPWGGNVAVVTALGVSRGVWLRAWKRAGQAPTRVVSVTPSTWRSPVLGGEWVSAPRAAVRTHEQRCAAALVGYPVGADEAPAILIGWWASHAGRVGRAIGKRAQKASLRAWTSEITDGEP